LDGKAFTNGRVSYTEQVRAMYDAILTVYMSLTPQLLFEVSFITPHL
jgi:hypothetical protein